MYLYALYQVEDGGDAGATKSDSYLMKGIFITEEKANKMKDKLVRDHNFYHVEIHKFYIPDELIGMIMKKLSEEYDG